MTELEKSINVKMQSAIQQAHNAQEVDEVPIGAPVRLVFEKTQATGQMVPEWEVVTQ